MSRCAQLVDVDACRLAATRHCGLVTLKSFESPPPCPDFKCTSCRPEELECKRAHFAKSTHLTHEIWPRPAKKIEFSKLQIGPYRVRMLASSDQLQSGQCGACGTCVQAIWVWGLRCYLV